MKAIDLTQEIYTGMPVFPGHAKTVVFDTVTHRETGRNLTDGYSYRTNGLLLCDHGPTHVDAVSHIDDSPDAPTIDKMSLENFYGPGLCLDISGLPEHSLVGPEEIKAAEKRAGCGIRRGDVVLFYTGHYDRHYPNPEYLENYTGFSYEAAVYLIEEKGIRLWGADTPSPDRPPTTNSSAPALQEDPCAPHGEPV